MRTSGRLRLVSALMFRSIGGVGPGTFGRRGRGVIAILGVGLGCIGSPAQPVVSVASPAQREQQAAEFRLSLNAAGVAARAGNIEAAERALEAVSTTSPNSAARRIETAQHLLHLADKLAREGDASRVRPMALRALDHLTQVSATPAARPSVKAAARSLAAFVCERYLGDRTAAAEHHRAAVQLLPARSRATTSKEALERIEQPGRPVRNEPLATPGR